MTLERFFELLPRDGWFVQEVESGRRLRRMCGGDCQCPIAAVMQLETGRYVPTWMAMRIVANKWSDPESGYQVISAADSFKVDARVAWEDRWMPGRAEMRARLAEHCGLVAAD
jgi:hypothetical protein